MKKLLYIKISENIMDQIISGDLKSGDKVKSVREMSLELTVNPKTVQKAFEYLEDKKIFKTVVGEGRYITNDNDVIETVKQQLVKEKITIFLDKMKTYNYSKEDLLKMIEEQYD